jgi:hypothetical protein
VLWSPAAPCTSSSPLRSALPASLNPAEPEISPEISSVAAPVSCCAGDVASYV